MVRRSHQALPIAIAGACLALSACGAASAPAAGSSPAASPASGSATLDGHFCRDASSFMRHIPAAPATRDATAAQARRNLRKVLRSTVAGFTSLKAEAPVQLRPPLRRIVAVYQSDEKIVSASGSLASISESMVRGNDSGSAAFQQVIGYIARSCR